MKKNETLKISTAGNGFVVIPDARDHCVVDDRCRLVFETLPNLLSYLEQHFDQADEAKIVDGGYTYSISGERKGY